MMSSLNEAEQDVAASPSDWSSKHKQELQAEAASCQDEQETREEEEEEVSTSLSVGDGQHLVDLGSSSEFVVDKECLLELLRSCRQCSRHCRVMKRVRGLKVVVSQKCCFCDHEFEWTNLPDDLSDKDDQDFLSNRWTPTNSSTAS